MVGVKCRPGDLVAQRRCHSAQPALVGRPRGCAGGKDSAPNPTGSAIAPEGFTSNIALRKKKPLIGVEKRGMKLARQEGGRSIARFLLRVAFLTVLCYCRARFVKLHAGRVAVVWISTVKRGLLENSLSLLEPGDAEGRREVAL